MSWETSDAAARGQVGVLGGLADEIADKGGDDLGCSDEGETNKGVDDGVLGFLDFGGVAARGGETDAAEDDEGDGEKAGDADDPLNETGDDGAGVGVAAAGDDGVIGVVADGDAVIVEVGAEQGADGAHDDADGHHNGEPDESLGEDFLAGGDFGGIAVGADVEIATIDDKAENEVGGGDGEIGGDIGNDEPKIDFELILIQNVEIDIAVPGDETENVLARGGGGGGGPAGGDGMLGSESGEAENNE